MKETLTRRLRALPAHVRRLHDRPEGRRGARHRGPASSPASWCSSWAATPNYAPLYSNLSSEDASAVVEQLDADGVPYELGNNGSTIMVPQDQVYSTRISLSGEGLPSNSGDGGYSILDDAGHLHLGGSRSRPTSSGPWRASSPTPSRRSTASTPRSCTSRCRRSRSSPTSRHPATASVLVDTAPGRRPRPRAGPGDRPPVASSIDGLDPEKVTVADSSGQVLSTTDGADGAGASTRDPADRGRTRTSCRRRSRRCSTGSSARATPPCQVTADLDFDKAVTETTTYTAATRRSRRCRRATSTETYTGPAGGAGGAGGVVGPDGQMDSGLTGGDGSSYEKTAATREQRRRQRVEHRESAPGAVVGLHVAVDRRHRGRPQHRPGRAGEHDRRGRRHRQEARRQGRGHHHAVRPRRRGRDRRGAQGRRGRRQERRADGPDPQGRHGSARRGPAPASSGSRAAAATRRARRPRRTSSSSCARTQADRLAAAQQQSALERVARHAWRCQRAERDGAGEMRDELAALVERQPEDVAALLRGWLVER